jgi:uncharacterized protein YxeA
MKKILIILCIIIFGTAAQLYFAKKNRENLYVVSKEPSLVFDEAKINRYVGARLTTSAYAKYGYFEEPNLIHLKDAVSATQFGLKDSETIKANEAAVILNVSGLNEVFDNVAIKKIELKDRVRVYVKDHVAITDYAEYIALTNVIETIDPVKLNGEGRSLQGQDGFRYDINQGVLTMFGQVDGVFKIKND